jgi:dihydromethanopterin reductase
MDPAEVLTRYPERWDISRLPYDGEADRWFDPAWLIGSG